MPLPLGVTRITCRCRSGGMIHLFSISSFPVAMFACLPSGSIEGSTVVPARQLAYCAALQNSAPRRFCTSSLLIYLVNCRIDFGSFALALATLSDFCLLSSVPAALLVSLMSTFRHLFDLAQILIFFAAVLRTLFIDS